MLKSSISILILSVFFSFTADEFKPLNDVRSFREKIALTGNAMQTIKAEFTQEKNISMVSEKMISKGFFYFSKPSKVRIEYLQPYKYLMIINGDKVYLKDGSGNDGKSLKGNKLFAQINRITAGCINGKILEDKDFRSKIFESKTQYKVSLSPVTKLLQEYFSMIEVYVDKQSYEVVKIDMREQSGDNTLMIFSKQQKNISLADEMFTIH